jgi:hypothetical protein
MKSLRHDKWTVAGSFAGTSTRRPLAATRAALALLAVVGATGWPTTTHSQTTDGTEQSVAALEKAFWACDHAATTGRIDSGAAITCGTVTEALKQRKFDGDFNAMLTWWRQHKEVQHLALAKTGGAR